MCYVNVPCSVPELKCLGDKELLKIADILQEVGMHGICSHDSCVKSLQMRQ